MTKTLVLAALLLGTSLPASAQTPYWTNGVPVATPPLTGLERLPADTYNTAPASLQQEGISTSQLKTYVGGCQVTGTQYQIVTVNSAGSGCLADSAAGLDAGALSLGASGTPGSILLGNATSGTLLLEPVTGALGTDTALLPANSGVIAELNLGQTWTGAQLPGTGGAGLMPLYNGTGTLATGATLKTVALTQALTAGAATVTLTGSSVFGMTPVCVGSDQTGANPVRVDPTSASTIALVGTGSDVIGLICVGN